MPRANHLNYCSPFKTFHRFAPFQSFQTFKSKARQYGTLRPRISEMRDRRRYLHWLFEAKKRFVLCVLDYIVTCNHIHLLVKDTGSNVIAESMQLNTEACSIVQTVQSLRSVQNVKNQETFQRTAIQWVQQGLENGLWMRDDCWSESIAVGSRSFVEKVKGELGFRVEPVPIVQVVQPLRSVQNFVQANTKVL